MKLRLIFFCLILSQAFLFQGACISPTLPFSLSVMVSITCWLLKGKVRKRGLIVFLFKDGSEAMRKGEYLMREPYKNAEARKSDSKLKRTHRYM